MKIIISISYSFQSSFLLQCLLLPSLLIFFPDYATTNTGAATAPPCWEKCGDLDIPYPFGIKEGCFLPGFQLTCDDSTTPPLTSIFNTSSVAVVGINIQLGQVRVDSMSSRAQACNPTGWVWQWILLPDDGPYKVSAASNKLVAAGCNTEALVYDQNMTSGSGCMSVCSKKSNITSGTCAGVGCCESRPPKGEKQLGVAIATMFNLKTGFDNCSDAFLVEEGGYVFIESHVWDSSLITNLAMVLDWSIGKSGCVGYLSEIAPCGENAYCANSTNSTGYLCRCRDGYDGNPCQWFSRVPRKMTKLYTLCSLHLTDIDECRNNPCYKTAHCKNTIPGFKCSCPSGSIGDGTINGTRCSKVVPVIEGVVASIATVILLFAVGVWLYWIWRKRKLLGLKEEYFKRNGGLLLSQKMSSSFERSQRHSKVFSAKELEKATDNYHESKILGSGGYGTVYKGLLNDGTIVAIKKSKVIDQSQLEQFINEVVILTQINHRNVVQLMGCCLETEVPLLVYEFISKGTLQQHIHNDGNFALRMSWLDRLRIATETADALSYLHSAASIPIYHRDVKAANILLDENLTAKVSDFGASRLVPYDEVQVATVVQGTFGYLDPEYLQSGELTAKSDVYSFGVVLAELLTGQKPVSYERTRENSNLATYFLSSMRDNALNTIIDHDVRREGDTQEIQAVAEVTRRCLQLKGENRPTMREVSQELDSINDVVLHRHHSWTDSRDDNENLLSGGEVTNANYGIDGNGTSTNIEITRFTAR